MQFKLERLAHTHTQKWKSKKLSIYSNFPFIFAKSMYKYAIILWFATISTALHHSSCLTVSSVCTIQVCVAKLIHLSPAFQPCQVQRQPLLCLLGSCGNRFISCCLWLSSQFCRIPSSKDLPCPRNLYFRLKFESVFISLFSRLLPFFICIGFLFPFFFGYQES